jgi:DnaJ-class molecular chaperone
MTTHYETLGIPREASAWQVKHSYRRLVKMCHPDKFPSGSLAQADAEKRIRDLNIAYSVLSKPASRETYDAKLGKRAVSYQQPDPEYCTRCGKPTGYWNTRKKAALCYRCMGPLADRVACGP